MLTTDELDAMRATSETAMPATCAIARPGAAAPTFDPDTGLYTTPTPATVYAGVCRVRTLNTQDIAVVVGDLHETKARYVATIPADGGEVVVDDVLTVTDGTDPHLIGRPLRITDIRYSEWLIDRRLVVEDLEQP